MSHLIKTIRYLPNHKELNEVESSTCGDTEKMKDDTITVYYNVLGKLQYIILRVLIKYNYRNGAVHIPSYRLYHIRGRRGRLNIYIPGLRGQYTVVRELYKTRQSAGVDIIIKSCTRNACQSADFDRGPKTTILCCAKKNLWISICYDGRKSTRIV